MYQSTTRAIRITVEPEFRPDQSEPSEARYIWQYTITITNEGEETVQLLARHWEITDAQGRTEVVDGPGVVGEQPVLGPGEAFTYASGAPLPTPTGFMGGHYLMVRQDGSRFEAQIPTFSLDSPHQPRRLQ